VLVDIPSDETRVSSVAADGHASLTCGRLFAAHDDNISQYINPMLVLGKAFEESLICGENLCENGLGYEASWVDWALLIAIITKNAMVADHFLQNWMKIFQ
jgi:hypothetical protein